MTDHKNEQVRTYVNGILYSLLSRFKLRRIAHDMFFKVKLENLLNECDEQSFRVQYE